MLSVAEFLKSGRSAVCSEPVHDNATVCVVDASFNPPTYAHLTLAKKCLDLFPNSTLVFLLSTGNVDKPSAEPAQLQSRVGMIAAMMESEFKCADTRLALTNESQFLDKAKALNQIIRNPEIVFAVGWDTFVRIEMQKYYSRPVPAVLADLFAVAELVVLTRAEDHLTKMAAAPPVQDQKISNDSPFLPFKNKIHIVESDSSTAQVSSSQARSSLQSLRALTPKAVAEYAIEYKIYPECIN